MANQTCPICGLDGGFHDSDKHHFSPRESWGPSHYGMHTVDDYLIEAWNYDDYIVVLETKLRKDETPS